MSPLVIVLLVGQASTTPASPSPYWNWSLPSPHHAAVVRITQRTYAGTGAVVRWKNKLVVITAHHVVEDSNQCNVQTYDGKSVSGVVTARDTKNDVAVIIAAVKDHPYLYVDDKDRASSGMYEIHGRGGPQGSRVLRHFQGSGHTFRSIIFVDAYALSGDSGGPITHKGKLVGVLIGGLGRNQAADLKDWPLVYPIKGAGPETIRATLNKALP